MQKNGEPIGKGALRYKTSKTLLDKKINPDIDSAFAILEAVK